MYFLCKKYNKQLIVFSPTNKKDKKQKSLLNLINIYFNFPDISIYYITSHNFNQSNFFDLTDLNLFPTTLENKIFYMNPLFSKVKQYKYPMSGYSLMDEYFNEYNCSSSLLINNEDILKDILNKFPNIKNSICINIRRSDKLIMPRFTILDKTYIYKIINEYKNTDIIFVSDDIEWCKKYFSKYKNVKFVEHINTNLNPIIYDLTVLTLCKHLIVDMQCTFSHWGILLNNNPQKQITICDNSITKINSFNVLPVIESNENKPLTLLIITRLTRIDNIPIIYENIQNTFNNTSINYIWYICYDTKFNLNIDKIKYIFNNEHIIFKECQSNQKFSADILNEAIFDNKCNHCLFTYILDDDNLLHANLPNIILKYKNSDLIINQLDCKIKQISNPQNLSDQHCITFIDWANVIMNTNILKYINGINYTIPSRCDGYTVQSILNLTDENIIITYSNEVGRIL